MYKVTILLNQIENSFIIDKLPFFFMTLDYIVLRHENFRQTSNICLKNQTV